MKIRLKNEKHTRKKTSAEFFTHCHEEQPYKICFPTLENLGAKVRSQNVSTVAGTSSQEFNAHLDARNSTTVEIRDRATPTVG